MSPERGFCRFSPSCMYQCRFNILGSLCRFRALSVLRASSHLSALLAWLENYLEIFLVGFHLRRVEPIQSRFASSWVQLDDRGPVIRDARVFILFRASASSTWPKSPSNGGFPVIPSVAMSGVLAAARITASSAGFTASAQCPLSICVCAHVFASCCGTSHGLIAVSLFAPTRRHDVTASIAVNGPVKQGPHE